MTDQYDKSTEPFDQVIRQFFTTERHVGKAYPTRFIVPGRRMLTSIETNMLTNAIRELDQLKVDVDVLLAVLKSKLPS